MRLIYLLLLFCLHLKAGHCASSEDVPSNLSLHAIGEGGQSKTVSSDPEFTNVEIEETDSEGSLREPKLTKGEIEEKESEGSLRESKFTKGGIKETESKGSLRDPKLTKVEIEKTESEGSLRDPKLTKGEIEETDSKGSLRDPKLTKGEIDETESANSLREPKFISFFNQHDDDREGLIENVQADVESATFLLNAIRSTSIMKEQIKEYRNLFSNGVKVCPLNRSAVRVGETCFEYFSEKLTFPRARHVCKSFGGDLASINLRDNFLYQIRQFYPKLSIDGTQYETWIGATRIPGTRNFQFFDGTVIFSSNARWNSGPREHNCLILDDVNLDQHFIIDDCDCYNKRSFLCQYDVVSIL